MDWYQTLVMKMKITQLGRAHSKMYTSFPKLNIIVTHKTAIKILNMRIFLMSLEYHYRKFQPHRLKFDQDMAANQWPVRYDKGTWDL